MYNLNLNSDEVEKFYVSKAETVSPVVTSEDVVVNKVGRELYENLFEDIPASNGT